MKCAIISDQVNSNIDESFKKISALGYRYVEIHGAFQKSIENCSKDEVATIKKLLDKYQLKVANLASTIFFLCPLYSHYKVSLFNPEFYVTEGGIKDHLKALHQACQIANELNCKTVRIFPFRFPDNEDIIVVGSDEDMNEITKHLKVAADIAKQYHITLVLENCPYSHLPKGEMTYKVMKQVNNPSLKLLWDPANSYRAEKNKVPSNYQTLSLEEEYVLISKDIYHIHLKNYHYVEGETKPFIHKSLLHGDIDYISLLSIINRSYTHYISLEPEVDYEKTIESMKDLLNIERDVT